MTNSPSTAPRFSANERQNSRSLPGMGAAVGAAMAASDISGGSWD